MKAWIFALVLLAAITSQAQTLRWTYVVEPPSGTFDLVSVERMIPDGSGGAAVFISYSDNFITTERRLVWLSSTGVVRLSRLIPLTGVDPIMVAPAFLTLAEPGPQLRRFAIIRGRRTETIKVLQANQEAVPFVENHHDRTGFFVFTNNDTGIQQIQRFSN